MMNKRILFVSFCLICSFFLNVSGLSAEEAKAKSIGDTSKWKTHRNENYGFEFSYPEDWNLSFTEHNSSQRATRGFNFELRPSPEVLKSTGERFSPSIGIIGRDISEYEKGWESVALTYFEDEREGRLFEGPQEVQFKGGPALKGIKLIPIDIGGCLKLMLFPSPDGKWIFNIVLKKFSMGEDYFTEVYNKVIDSFNFL